jgi:rod shape-determining protein MreC
LYLPSKLHSKYIALVAISLFLLILPFHKTVRHLFVLLSKGVNLNPRRISRRIDDLEKENLRLMLQIQGFEEAREENRKLKMALQFKETSNIELIGAEIIAFNPSSWRRIVVINAGSNDGVGEGLFAVNENGHLLGKIITAKNAYSYLMLVNDPDFNIPVIVGQSSIGLLQGGLDEVKVLYLEKAESIKKGDKVWLKSAPNSLPLYIGRVSNVVDSRDNLFWDVEVELFSQAFPLHSTFIVK